MYKLIKKYRLIWDANSNELLINPYIEYDENTETLVNCDTFFETDYIDEVNNFIQNNNLIFVEPNNIIDDNLNGIIDDKNYDDYIDYEIIN